MAIPSEVMLFAARELMYKEVLSDARVGRFLSSIEYDKYSSLSSSAFSERIRGHQASMLLVASKMERLFQLQAPDAPGLVFFGGELKPALASPMHAHMPTVSVTGKGTSLREAFESCVGEASEYLSQLELDDDVVEKVDASQAIALLDDTSRCFVESLLQQGRLRPSEIDWLPALRLSDRGRAFIPADLCWRRPAIRRGLTPPFLLGTGTAAGPSFEAAILHGLLELVERDALGLWWRGGRRGRPVDSGSDAYQSARAALGQLRQGRTTRKTWFLDVTSDVCVPCVVAMSCDPDGTNFAFGAAARLSMPAALRSALLELCQMELAYAAVAAKRSERGDAALNDRDRDHLRRATSIDAASCELLHPLPDLQPSLPAPASRDALIAKLAELGIEVYAIDITRPRWGIPAVRLLAPALQLEPSELVSERLGSAVAETGGGDKFTRGTPLL